MRTRWLVILVSTLISQQSWAQTIESETSAMGEDQAGAPTFIAPITVRETIEIRGGTEKDEATIEVGFKKGANIWTGKFVTPVNNETKEGVFATRDGLADAIRFKMTYGRFLFNPANRVADWSKGYTYCTEAAIARGYDRKVVEAEIRSPTSKFDCDTITSPGSALTDDFFPTERDEDDDIRPVSRQKREDTIAKLKKVRPEYLKAVLDGAWVPRLEVFWSIGTEDFEFLDQMTFSEQETNKTVRSAGISLMGVNMARRYTLGLTYRYEMTYEAGEESTVCTEGDLSGVFNCITSPVGAPTRKNSDLASLSINVLRPKWAIASVLTFDFEDDEYGIEVPIYLVRKATDSTFTGGLSLGWTSDEKDLTAQVFVGAPFKLFN